MGTDNSEIRSAEKKWIIEEGTIETFVVAMMMTMSSIAMFVLLGGGSPS